MMHYKKKERVIAMNSRVKEIEIAGRQFKIRKFEARTGLYVLVKVFGIFIPMIEGIDMNKLISAKTPESPQAIDFSGIDFTKTFSGLMNLPEKEFNEIQNKCLSVCFEVLPGGDIPILNENLTFGVIGLEDDAATHSLLFNVTSFFKGSPLTLGAMGMWDMFKQYVKI